MKAISIRNPWATEILNGQKKYEFRTWSTSYRGPLLICSSANPKIKGTISGHALVVATLKNIFLITNKNYRDFSLYRAPAEKCYAWQLTDLKFIKPFTVRGKLSLYDVADDLIEYIDISNMTEQQVDEVYFRYYEPLEYKGKK